MNNILSLHNWSRNKNEKVEGCRTLKTIFDDIETYYHAHPSFETKYMYKHTTEGE